MLSHRVNIVILFTLLILLAIATLFYHVQWWYFLLPVILYVIVAGIGSAFVWTGYHIKTYCSNRNINEKIVAITFDDGPTPETLKVLALLNKYNFKATFFCIGRQIEKYPEIIKQVVDEGHTVGNHTYSHSPRLGFFSKQHLVQELNDTHDLMRETTGKTPLFFRPPYGVTTPNLAYAIRKAGYKAIGWNIRSLDAVIKDEARIFQRIKSRLSPGSIILLHDTSQKTVNVLEQLLVLLQENNYKSVTVDRLLNLQAYEE